MPTDEDLESFVEKLSCLKPHHCFLKIQSIIFKETKSKLGNKECAVLTGFSKNFSFVKQDCDIENYNWVNRLATF